MKLTTLIQIAGLIHVGLIVAGALMPQVVKLRQHIGELPPFIRQLFWVYYSFIALSLVGFGALSYFFAPELASGSTLARAVCGFLAAFWTLRLFMAEFVYDVKPYLTNGWRKLGYHTTNVVFALFPVIYGWGALAGGAR